MDLTAQGEGGGVPLGGDHVLIDDGSSGLHRVGHLVGDVSPHGGRRVGGHENPEKNHPRQGNSAGDDADSGGKPFVCEKLHKLSPKEKSFGVTGTASKLAEML